MSANESEQVRVASADHGIRLAGTYCTPEDVRGIAILLPGSGPQDRDETIAGQKPFLVLASELAHRGVASLRCDDRGVGGSQGDYLSIDGATLLADVRCQLRWLRERQPDTPLAVIGHSQGGLFALRLARVERVDCVVLLAAAIRPGLESMMSMRERMASDAGYSGAQWEAYLEHSRALFRTIIENEDISRRRHEVQRLIEFSVRGATDADFQPDFASVMEYVEYAVADAMEWEVRELLRSDPRRHLMACTVPVLGLWGDRDRHLDPVQELGAFEACAPVGCRGLILQGRNHLFQRSATGAMTDYRSDGPPMGERVAALIAEWVVALSDRSTRD